MEVPSNSTNTEFMSAEELKQNVLSNYNFNILNIENIKFKDTEKQRAVFKISSSKGDKCLKKVYYDEPTLLFIYSVIEWLNVKGISCPKLIPTKQGLRYVKYNNNLFIATNWIDGRKCNYDDNSDVIASARNLAKIHKFSKGFKPIPGSIIHKNDPDIIPSYSKHFLQLLEFSNKAFIIKDKFSKLYLDSFDYNIEKAQESVYLLSTIDFSKPLGDEVSLYAICHNDYVNKNIIFSEDENIHIIDFDKTKMDAPVFDICSFLKRILKRKNTSWDFEVFRSAIEGYEEIRPLSEREYKTILAILMFPQKYWKISRDYYRNIKKCNKESFATILKKIVKQQEDHSNFCLKLKEYIDYKYSNKKI